MSVEEKHCWNELTQFSVVSWNRVLLKWLIHCEATQSCDHWLAAVGSWTECIRTFKCGDVWDWIWGLQSMAPPTDLTSPYKHDTWHGTSSQYQIQKPRLCWEFNRWKSIVLIINWKGWVIFASNKHNCSCFCPHLEISTSKNFCLHPKTKEILFVTISQWSYFLPKKKHSGWKLWSR